MSASGSQPGNKGDVTAESWRIEAKQTIAPRFSLTLKVWRAIEREAIQKGKEPALVIEMAGRKLVVLDYNTWLALQA